jgi:hypothetical protein
MLHVDRYFAIRAREGNRPAYEAALWNGLLLDPENPHERVWPGVKELLGWPSLEHFSCVVLLGEPGRGKSTEWRFQHSAIEADDDSGKSFLVDLRDLCSTGRLSERVSAVGDYPCSRGIGLWARGCAVARIPWAAVQPVAQPFAPSRKVARVGWQ